MGKKKKKSKKIRNLTIGISLSIFLNILFAVSFLYTSLKEKEIHVLYEQKPITKHVSKKDFTNSEYLAYFSNLSFRELIALLSNKQIVEEGYKRRDLALGCLITFHDFNLEKALPSKPLSKRTYFFNKEDKESDVTLVPGLSDYHYESIIHYAYTEKWPLTPKGIHSLLSQCEKPRDSSLEQAFLVTTEFHLIRNLMNQDNSFLSNSTLLDLIAELPFEFIHTFSQSQIEKQEITPQRRRLFLLEGLSLKSSLCGQILLQTDFLFVVKKLDDQWLLYLLDNLETKTDDVEQLCFELLKSSRSDDVYRLAAKKLYQFADEPMPDPYDHQEALQRFVYSDELREKWQKEQNSSQDNLSAIIWPEEKSPLSLYVVKKGDSLWKIARRFKVDLDELIKLNHLETDRIYPGREILIPE